MWPSTCSVPRVSLVVAVIIPATLTAHELSHNRALSTSLFPVLAPLPQCWTRPSSTRSTSCSPCIILVVAYSMLLQLLHMPICVPPHLAKANAGYHRDPHLTTVLLLIPWIYCCSNIDDFNALDGAVYTTSSSNKHAQGTVQVTAPALPSRLAWAISHVVAVFAAYMYPSACLSLLQSARREPSSIRHMYK